MEAWIWLVIGLMSGWLAGKLMKGRDYGFTGNLILGLLGGLLGVRVVSEEGPAAADHEIAVDRRAL